MTMSIDLWHQRYLQQANWTQNIRKYLYQKCRLRNATRVLDVGCGTGALEKEYPENTAGSIFGVDIDIKRLQFAKKYSSTTVYSTSDCRCLPFSAATFDISLCHFLLLWVDGVEDTLAEMKRVTHPGGYLLAMAEPDYGGRIDFPNELVQLGTWQTQALKEQGANPFTGRRLRALFSNAGLTDVEVGVLGGQWTAENPGDFELEWQVLATDLLDNHDFQKHAKDFKTIELASRATQQRILFVPVFYAFGMVPI